MDPKFFTFSTFFDLLCRGRVPIPGQKMAAGARALRQNMAAGASHPRQRYIREWMPAQESSATALYP